MMAKRGARGEKMETVKEAIPVTINAKDMSVQLNTNKSQESQPGHESSRTYH